MISHPHQDCVICEQPLELRPGIVTRTCDAPMCRTNYQRHLHQGGATCFSCGRPLAVQLKSREVRTCGDLQCQVSDRRNTGISAERRCRFCRVPLASNQHSTGVCEDRDCLTLLFATKADERERQARERFEQGTRLGETCRDELAVIEGITDPETYFVTVVKHFRGELTTLPDSRREELRAGLVQLVGDFEAQQNDANTDDLNEGPTGSAGDSNRSESPVEGFPVAAGDAFDGDETEETGDSQSEGTWPDVGPAGERLTANVCGHCRGYCCQQGGTHAFLSVNTIESFLRNRPDVKPDQVVDEYLNHLPELSYDGSCVFQARTGCSLPQEMRAATCGEYFCWGQQELRAALEKGAPRRAFVMLSTDREVVEGRFLDGAVSDDAASRRCCDGREPRAERPETRVQSQGPEETQPSALSPLDSGL